VLVAVAVGGIFLGGIEFEDILWPVLLMILCSLPLSLSFVNTLFFFRAWVWFGRVCPRSLILCLVRIIY
jgi:hypothetical protein